MLMTLLLALASSGILQYGVFEKSLRETLYQTQSGLLDQRVAAIDDVFAAAQNVCTHIIVNGDVEAFFRYSHSLKVYKDVALLLRVVNLLNTQTESHAYIDTIRLYDFLDGVWLSSGSSHYRRIDVGLSDEYISRMKGSYWLETGSSFLDIDLTGKLAFVNTYYSGFSEVRAAAIVTIDRARLGALLQRDTDYGNFVLLDEDGSVLIGDAPDDIGELALDDKQGELNGGAYLYSVKDSAYSNFRCAIITDDGIASERTRAVRSNIILTALSLAGAIAIAVFFISSYVYAPVKNVYSSARNVLPDGERAKLDELTTISRAMSLLTDQLKSARVMSEAHEKEWTRLREQAALSFANDRWLFFRHLLYGTAGECGELLEEARKFSFPLNEKYLVLLVRHALPAERAQSLLADQLRACRLIFHMHECETGVHAVIISFSAAEAPPEQLAANAANAFCAVCASENARAFSLLSDVCDGISTLPGAFAELLRISRYSFAFKARCMPIGGIPDAADSRALYALKDRLYNSFCARNPGESGACIRMYREALFSNSPARVDYLYHCHEVLETAIRALAKSRAPRRLLDPLTAASSHFDSLFSDADAFFLWLTSFAETELARDELDDAGDEYPLAVSYMLKRIESDYASDLSLGEIAAELSLSEQYLSRIFFEAVGAGFKERLTDVRLTHAKTLLADPKNTITAVSSQVGYNNSKQFIRIFKKYQGVTPGEYKNSTARR